MDIFQSQSHRKEEEASWLCRGSWTGNGYSKASRKLLQRYLTEEDLEKLKTFYANYKKYVQRQGGAQPDVKPDAQDDTQIEEPGPAPAFSAAQPQSKKPKKTKKVKKPKEPAKVKPEEPVKAEKPSKKKTVNTKKKIPPKVVPKAGVVDQNPNMYVFKGKEDWLLWYKDIELNKDESQPLIGFRKAVNMAEGSQTEIVKAFDVEFGTRFFGRRIIPTLAYYNSGKKTAPEGKAEIMKYGKFGVYKVSDSGGPSILKHSSGRFAVQYKNLKWWFNLSKIVNWLGIQVLVLTESVPPQHLLQPIVGVVVDLDLHTTTWLRLTEYKGNSCKNLICVIYSNIRTLHRCHCFNMSKFPLHQ